MFSPLVHDDPYQLGAYRLVARLGSGGMGTVYLARSASGRTVALKTMHARIATDPVFRTRFRLEVDAARVIGPVHGARVFDADPLAETPWLATEYVLGPQLDDAVTLSGPLAEPAVRCLGALLCAALAQLHDSDVVHRDLKPSNIMITADGPKVIDFGIARAIGDDRLTRTGAAAGTPAYMSPEQATGQEHTSVGDVFALAGVLTYAATGHGPFGSGQPADLLYRVRYAEADLTGLPQPLIPVLTRCLSKNPADRPSTTELAAQLVTCPSDFAQHLPESLLAEIARRAERVWSVLPHRLLPPADTSPEPPSISPQRAVSRRKLLTVGGGSVMGVAAAGAGAWTWFDRKRADDDTDSSTSTAGGAPRALWEADASSSGTRQLIMPIGDVIATWSRGEFVALDAKSGERRWSSGLLSETHQITSDGTALYGFLPKGYGEQGPYVGDKGLSVHTFTPAPGTPHRRIGQFSEFADSVDDAEVLAVGDGVLCLGARREVPSHDVNERSKDWYLLAVDLRTGKKLWEEHARQFYPGDEAGAVSAKAVGKRLIVCRKETTGSNPLVIEPHFSIYAVDIRTGKWLWGWDIPRESDDKSNMIPGQLALDQEHVYVASGYVWALRHSDGEEVWKFGKGRNQGAVAKGARLYGTPAVKDGVVYAAEGTRGLVAMNAATGKLLWEEAEDLTKDEEPSLDLPPIIGKKYAYAHLTTGLGAIDLRTHKSVWTYRTSAVDFGVHERAKRLICADGSTMTALPFE
ncbi:PQQ-binding-like beta-propeller repeat protein [Streptomyces sp. NBC_00191]|uniref:protein kinase domain-containing protein n=1 Tax=Streptomyces sp. NBC_00191 TaxID=2975674 RepID=UPI003252B40D